MKINLENNLINEAIFSVKEKHDTPIRQHKIPGIADQS